MAVMGYAAVKGVQEAIEHAAYLVTERIESYGFTSHWKPPHDVGSESGLNNLPQAIRRGEQEPERMRAEYAAVLPREQQ